jgi:hypothetical protein
MSTVAEWLQTLPKVHASAPNDLLNTSISFYQDLRLTSLVEIKDEYVIHHFCKDCIVAVCWKWIRMLWNLYLLSLLSHLNKPPFRFPNGFANIGACSLPPQISSESCAQYVLHPAVISHPSQYWWWCTSWHWPIPSPHQSLCLYSFFPLISSLSAIRWLCFST